MTGDIFDQVAALVHPPTPPQRGEEPTTASEVAAAEVERRRADTAASLRAAWDSGDVDPLLAEVHRARQDKYEADQRLRLLVAFAREYVSPRPYPAAVLAEAAGLANHSSIRSFYGDNEIDAVGEITGSKRVPRKS